MRFERQKVKVDENIVSLLMKEFNLSKKFSEILASRGIKTKEEARRFLKPNLNDLNNALLLKDIKESAARIKLAIEKKEKILVFGDYDVDGISATYILETAIKENGGTVCHFIPHRVDDGYGLTESTVKHCLETFRPNLIVTVDCGISCFKEVEQIKQAGVDIIITDHHEVPEILPNALSVNPKIQNQKYPCNFLCGAGVAFKLVTVLFGLNYAKKFLAICAIATIADIVPLRGENRTIVKLGLENVKDLPLGINILAKKIGLKEWTSTEVSFKLSPRINAPGRMGKQEIAASLYFEKDEKRILKLISEIEELNDTRKDYGSEIFEDAERQIRKLKISDKRSIVLVNNEWEHGILGIIAAKICSDYNRPTILFSKVGNVLKGSGRSIKGINMIDALNYANELGLVEHFGGHELACGLSILEENFTRFQNAMENFTTRPKFDDIFETKKEYFASLTEEEIDLKLAMELSLLEPIGCENKQVVFKLDFKDIVSVEQNKKDSPHLFIKLKSGLRLICFWGYEYFSALMGKNRKQALVEIGLDNFRGNENIKAEVKSFNFLYFDKNENEEQGLKAISLFMFKQNNDAKALATKLSFDELRQKINMQGKFGNLFITYSVDTAVRLAGITKFSIFKYNLTDINGESAILLCPESFKCVKDYQNIILCEKPICDEVLGFKNEDNDVFIVDVDENNKFLSKISLGRDQFELVFKQVQKISGFNNLYYVNILDYYKKNELSKHKINLTQFIVCISVFNELGILAIENKGTSFSIKIKKNVKRNLEESEIYKKITKLKE